MKYAKKVLLIVFILFILLQTIIGRPHLSERVFMTPFHEFHTGAWRDILLNIILFIPIGFIIGKPKGILFGLVLSVLIETIQYMFMLGFCELDDILNNTLGTAIGVILLKVFRNKIKSAITTKDKRTTMEQEMYRNHIKRALDLLIGIIAIPFFLLAYIIFAPIIKLTDKGPVFYNAERIGLNGKLFKMYKFRSMYVNAPDIRLADGSTYNGENDPRVTKIGKFMRATSIDELPQIINILNGTMSLIGPRPDPPDWIDKYPEDIRVFLSVRPGLTGYSQAYFRNAADGEQKMKNDAFYAQHVSFAFDVKIFFKSIAMVLGHENTYKDLTTEGEAVKAAESLKK